MFRIFFCFSQFVFCRQRISVCCICGVWSNVWYWIKRFVWNGEKSSKIFKQKDDVWLLKYQKLLDYKQKHNTTIVPQHNKELGRWVNDQRVNFKRNKLTQFRIEKLNEINFVWDVKKLKEWKSTHLVAHLQNRTSQRYSQVLQKSHQANAQWQ